MENCIFCKIANKEIPAKFIYEDEICVAFHDINPKAKTHLLIISKKHIPSVPDLMDGDQNIIGHMISKIKEIAENQGLTGYKLQINVGKDGGQEIFHFHIHLMSNQN